MVDACLLVAQQVGIEAERVVEQRNASREQEDQKRAGNESGSSIFGSRQAAPRWDDFPEVEDGGKMYQKNEGEWEFSLDESDDGSAVVLDVQVGKYMDTSLVKVCTCAAYGQRASLDKAQQGRPKGSMQRCRLRDESWE